MLNLKAKKSLRILCPLLASIIFFQIGFTAKSKCIVSDSNTNNTVNYKACRKMWDKTITPDGITKYQTLFRGFYIDFFVDSKSNVTVSSLNPYYEDMFQKLVKYMAEHTGVSATHLMDSYGINVPDKIYITKNLTHILGLT
ncbi:MAG: hypothetical protein Q4D57_01500 [Clostridia bacterium]|nr:hypothetical protein [Clostridia bacterium]